MATNDLMHSFSIICKALFMVLYLSAFTLFVAADAVNAFKKRKHWVPGKALVLSALSISALRFMDIIYLESDHLEGLKFLLQDQLFIDGGRIGTCVFIAYVLPGMVASRSEKDFRLIAAFVITLSGQVLSELSYVFADKKDYHDCMRMKRHRIDLHWLFASRTVFFVSILFFIYALCSTVLASYTIRGILSKRVSVILAGDEMVMNSGSGNPEIEKDGWSKFEEEIFKSWIVARVSQPNYVISRSVVNSAAAMVVSLCIVLSFFKAILILHRYFGNFLKDFKNDVLVLLKICAMCGFFLVGWAVVLCRWITTLIYFQKLGKGTLSFSRYFCVEEFWTNSIVEVIRIYDMKTSPLYQRPDGINSWLAMVVARMNLHKLFHVVCALQMCTVWLSKSTQFLFELVFSTLNLRWLLNKDDRSLISGRRYEEYADILERLFMPGEDPASLWNANRSSITQVHLLMKKGRDEGKECNILISNSHQFSLQFIEEGYQLMDRLSREALPKVSNYFPNLEEPCWKMTTVCLLGLLIQLDGHKSDRLSSDVKACRQAWDLLSLVDHTNIQGDRLIGFTLLNSLNTDSHQSSVAADKEFCRLQTLYKDLPLPSQTITAVQCVRKLSDEAEDVLKAHMLLEDHAGQNCALAQGKTAHGIFELHDSINWMEIAPKYNLYKLCRVVEMDVNGVDYLTAWTRRSLGNVIVTCLSKLPNLVIKYSRELAQEFDGTA